MSSDVIYSKKWVRIVSRISLGLALLVIAFNSLFITAIFFRNSFIHLPRIERVSFFFALNFILLSIGILTDTFTRVPSLVKKLVTLVILVIMSIAVVGVVVNIVGMNRNNGAFSLDLLQIHTLDFEFLIVNSSLVMIGIGYFLFSFPNSAQAIVFSVNAVAFFFIFCLVFHNLDEGFPYPFKLLFLNVLSIYLISLQFLTKDPAIGYTAFFVRDDFVGKMLRMQLPITVLGYITFGFACLFAHNFFNLPLHFYLMVMITAAIVIFTLILFKVAGPLGKLEVERRQYQEQFAYLALHDRLTHLPNHLLLLERLHQAILSAKKQNARLAVIFLDLDRFKLVNDNFGYEIGDQLLIDISHRLESAKGEEDIFFRMNGDEFVVLIPELKQDEYIETLLHRIQDIFKEPFVYKKQRVFLSCSMGVSLFPTNGTRAEALMKNADIAMYRAKANGRNTYAFFNEQMHQEVQEHLMLNQDIFTALHRKEFYLTYQPIIDTKTWSITSTEVLLRWNHPRWKNLPIPRIFEIVTDMGLLPLLDEWILKTACTQNLSWREQGLSFLPIAFNFPGYLFDYKNALKAIGQTIDEINYPGEYLEVEMNENVIMSLVDEAMDMVTHLREKGISFSFDDFGIGSLNFSHLIQFPLKKLKIDQSLVFEIGHNSKSEVIIKMIISMAHKMGLQVVAEGVETKKQLSFLIDHHCDLIQGYYFSRPIIAEKYSNLLVKKSLS